MRNQVNSDFASPTVSAPRTIPHLGLHNAYSFKDVISIDMGDAAKKTSLHDTKIIFRLHRNYYLLWFG